MCTITIKVKNYDDVPAKLQEIADKVKKFLIRGDGWELVDDGEYDEDGKDGIYMPF